MNFRVLQYRGRSLVSLAIRFQTRSLYSHSAIMDLDNGETYEAWHRGGVLLSPDPFAAHSRRTYIDVFSIKGGYDAQLLRHFLDNQLGKKYDFLAVARFLTRRRARDNTKWFCSELVAAAFNHAGLDLLNPRAHHALLSPRDIGLSPHLRYRRTIDNAGE